MNEILFNREINALEFTRNAIAKMHEKEGLKEEANLYRIGNRDFYLQSVLFGVREVLKELGVKDTSISN